MTADKMRQDAQPAFVLHTYPYLETSLLVETFTRNLGRVPLVAKGAKRPKSALEDYWWHFNHYSLLGQESQN